MGKARQAEVLLGPSQVSEPTGCSPPTAIQAATAPARLIRQNFCVTYQNEFRLHSYASRKVSTF